MSRKKLSRRLAVLAVGLGLVSAGFSNAGPAVAQSGASTPGTAPSYAQYAGPAEDPAGTRAFFEAVVKSVTERRAENPSLKAVTITYNPSGAPTFRTQISSAVQIWNGAVSNVRL